ncbi:FAD-dependent oxidoreductase domain-containing protein 1 [Drosophila mojavensis]|uniref:Uncharacterized protein, isoform A n=1 Tax=Drosophila mojavensis TaxID=7230 RepID=B4KE65_DROMO|nr:FAD-dependent oxidoreductase domain-containing protein 1 [Drosophila mojavensis]EDW11810.2 uncharacterized protein Dmoj_GI17347, isoform A [Drosophila mojavensis]KRG02923.1 uncharacterized protein Dmoj_GI17347, isoform B [Drosophila mojavensis]
MVRKMLRCRHVIRQIQVPLLRAHSTGSNPPGSDDPNDLHPIRRTFRLLGKDMRKIKEFFVPKEDQFDSENKPQPIATSSKFNFSGEKGSIDEFPTHCDVLIIGGGGMGSSIAYWLKQKARDGLNVVVVEKDIKHERSATRVSINGLSHHFALPETIQMSLFAADFLREAPEHFGTDIPIKYMPYGHLVLAGEADAEMLKQTSQLQNDLGARNELLTADRLASKFPWLNTKGIALGCYGQEREGWFDPWALLANYKRAAHGYGAHFVHGEAVAFEFVSQADIIVSNAEKSGYQSLDKVIIQQPGGAKRAIKFALCVIAAGINSGDVARLARIGLGEGVLHLPLPIDARKRYMYKIKTQDQSAPGMAMPMVVDATAGTYIRRVGLGGDYVCGHNALPGEKVSADNLDVDPTYFNERILPALIERVPAFANAKVVNSMAGLYDYNVYDDNGILGPHPYYHNLYIASGFSGQGIQQTPALGRAISELIMDGQFRTLDLSRLGFDRLIVDKPMYEFHALN